MNQGGNAATVRFNGGCEVLSAPTGQMAKRSSYCIEQEKSAARSAYQATLNERNARPEYYRDV